MVFVDFFWYYSAMKSVHLQASVSRELHPFSGSHRSLFGSFSKWIALATGHPFTFIAACLLIVSWLLTGPLFRFSNTWQLVINTSTTIITFLMVFLIQNTQNRDSAAVQIKLDELIRANGQAHNVLLNLEELTEAELNIIRQKYERLAEEAREILRQGKKDIGVPEVRL